MEKDYLIEYILGHSTKTKREDLEKMSLESLVMIKVQIEIEISRAALN